MRRFLAKLLVFLLLGAIVNVAVAWTLALQSVPKPEFDFTGDVGPRGSPRKLLIETGCKAGGVMIEASGDIHGPSAPATLPCWSRARSLTDAEVQSGVRMLEQARGWPCLSFYWRRIDQPGGTSALQGGLPVGLGNDTALPVLPIWPGLAINTVFYGVLILPLTYVPIVRTLRDSVRANRIRRGQCPACKYPITHSPVCTECGEAIKGVKAGAAPR